MLEIKKLTKVYNTGGFKQKALDGVSVNFREYEFASILGPSGSGKTTFLNIIGGLDHYTSGDLIINGTSTKKYKEKDWDSYRNHRIGFVFQSYNLISHQTILSNVKLALTLSGISKKEALEKAKKALCDVGLEKHMNKKPNQLSGGQMQRVAIARALVNDPDILLADEPTGALDSDTSVQIMELLKKIAKEKLIIMVTHNPELAKEYSSRIITLKDGKITSDSNPYDSKHDKSKNEFSNDNNKKKKTNMSFKTALSLSFNNLMTKKARTLLVAFAGSIGIIGIALILAVSTGFQNYVDSIQEETLTSYPLTLSEEAADITGVLLSMTNSKNEKKNGNNVKEQQYISSMLSNIKSNDLKSFKKYTEDNFKKIKKDISTIKYLYSVDPLIYTYDATNKLSKINPSNLFSSMSSGMMSTYSNFSSIFSQMIDNDKTIEEQYDVLAGRLPKKYDEMIIVLSDPNSISDLLVYSLGLRDTNELNDMVTKIMSGQKVDVRNEALTFTYEDLMNVKLKLIMPTDKYRYNETYKVFEDMSEDENYMKNLYEKSESLKIVGIVTKKEGTSSAALQPGVSYRADLIDHIINYSKKSEIVKKQLSNEEVDAISGKRFDSKKNDLNLDFSNILSVDNEKLKSAFNININENEMKSKTQSYMTDISNSITTDITPAKNLYDETFNKLIDGVKNSINEEFSLNDVDSIVDNYIDSYESGQLLTNLENKYVIPKDTYKTTFLSLIKGLLKVYVASYVAYDPSFTTDYSNPIAVIDDNIFESVKTPYIQNAAIIGTEETMAKAMTEALMKKTILTKVGELAANLSNSFAKAFNVDQEKIASAFKVNLSEEELTRVMASVLNKKESNCKTNLISLGYQDKESPTMISYYFNSFDGKEHFIKFINSYNKMQKKQKNKDKVINFSDTTGILMSSVKTIVNAVSYVLIAFVSISLVVSSIMIGVITYISVYERTKEIGILRSIGASKHNISSIFNAETFIIGLLSGIIGIGISYSLIPIINIILHHYIGNIPLSAKLNPNHGMILVGLGILLTIIGGLIPAKSASKKDPVEALRSE